MKEIRGKKKKDKIAATLMLCFCVIALTSIFTIKSNIDKIKESAGQVPVSEKTTTDNAKAKSKSASKSSAVDSVTAADKEASAKAPVVDSNNSDGAKLTFIQPIIDGTVSKAYSMDMIVYSKTLDKFMTHPGCDVKSDKSKNVVAAASGTVSFVGKDDKYGTTVEITHSNGLKSRYCNLATDTLVEKGDVITQGQSIGTVGNTGLYESMEEPHLHLEFLKNDKVVNPEEFINFK